MDSPPLPPATPQPYNVLHSSDFAELDNFTDDQPFLVNDPTSTMTASIALDDDEIDLVSDEKALAFTDQFVLEPTHPVKPKHDPINDTVHEDVAFQAVPRQSFRNSQAIRFSSSVLRDHRIGYNNSSDEDEEAVNTEELDRVDEVENTLSKLLGNKGRRTTTSRPFGKLTNVELRMLRKELVGSQVRQELSHLAASTSLRSLQPPSFPEQNAAYVTPTPLLKHAFHEHVVSFPFLKAADPKFWVKVQKFLDDLRKRGLGKSREPIEAGKRKRIYKRLERMSVLLYNTAIKLKSNPVDAAITGEGMDTVRLDQSFEQEKMTHHHHEDESHTTLVNGFHVDVITAREASNRGRFRTTYHPEFLIKTIENNGKPLHVIHDHKAIRKLQAELRRQFPHIQVPVAPIRYEHKRQQVDQDGESTGPLYAEKDRLIVRAFLRRLISDPAMAKSDIMRKFLTDGYCEPGFAEMMDAERRAKVETSRIQQLERVKNEAERRVRMMQEDMAQLRKELMSNGGMERMLRAVENIAEVSELPAHYQVVFEWGRINFASFLYHTYYASDDSHAKLEALKRSHGMMPYRTLKGILRISNPTRMAKAMADLFLARPFGGKSLMQRMVMASLAEELKFCIKDIEATEMEIGDPGLCRKIKTYVHNLDQRYKEDYNLSDAQLLAKILRDRARNPMLTESQLSRVWPDGQTAPPDQQLWTRLRRLMALESRRRDKEQMAEVVLQPGFTELIKELVAVVYGPLAKVYQAANVADYVMDTKAFIDDVISVVTNLESNVLTTNNPLDPFIDLCERHQQSFYHFVHRVYSRDKDGLFRQMAGWLGHLQQFLSNGIVELDLQALVERHVAREDQSAFVGDMDKLKAYREQLQARRNKKLRERVVRGGETWDENELSLLLGEMGFEASMDDVMELNDNQWHERDMEEEQLEEELGGGGIVVGQRTNFGKWRRSMHTSGNKRTSHTDPPVPEPDFAILPSLLKDFVDAVCHHF